MVYNCGNENPISFYNIKPRSSPNISIEKLRLKTDIDPLLAELNLVAGRTVKESKARLLANQKTQRRLYEEKKWNSIEINFVENNSLQFDDISIVDQHLIYGACSSKRSLEQIHLKRDSVGIQGTAVTVVSYHESWEKVHCLLLHKSSLLVFYGKGIFMFNLDTQVSLTVVPESSGYIPRYGYVHKDGFLFTSNDDHRLYFWQNSQITTFAGDSEGGSRDGTVQFARFYKISSICVEFDHVVYLSDYATGSIRMLTTLKNTASFLKAVGKLSTAFSVHEKHQSYDTKTMDEAIALVTQCNDTPQENEENNTKTFPKL